MHRLFHRIVVLNTRSRNLCQRRGLKMHRALRDKMYLKLHKKVWFLCSQYLCHWNKSHMLNNVLLYQSHTGLNYHSPRIDLKNRRLQLSKIFSQLHPIASHCKTTLVRLCRFGKLGKKAPIFCIKLIFNRITNLDV